MSTVACKLALPTSCNRVELLDFGTIAWQLVDGTYTASTTVTHFDRTVVFVGTTFEQNLLHTSYITLPLVAPIGSFIAFAFAAGTGDNASLFNSEIHFTMAKPGYATFIQGLGGVSVESLKLFYTGNGMWSGFRPGS